ERDEVWLPAGGPQILVCTEGTVLLRGENGPGGRRELELSRGNSVWLAAGDPAVVLTPAAGSRTQVFRATPGTCEN
ncbi:MAG: mannose-6-phosphate isomerase, class I, partial [Haloechinothrix sp.]